MHRKKCLVLIPSATWIPDEMQSELGKLPPVHVPLADQPFLQHIIESYRAVEMDLDFCVVLHHSFRSIESVDQPLALALQRNIICHYVQETRSLGDTLRDALAHLPLETYEGLYINFGDTAIHGDISCDSDCIFYANSEESYRWTIFERLGDSIAVKDKEDLGCDGPRAIFTGLFYMEDPKRFLEYLDALHAPTPSFYGALTEYLRGRNFETRLAGQWLDVGHIDTYYDAKRTYIQARFFNEIRVDARKGIIEKRSTHRAKFKDEVNWYLNLPPSLSFIAPRVFDYFLDVEAPYVKLEYYGYPILSDLFLFSQQPMSSWHRIIQTIFWVVAEMQAHRAELSDEEKQLACREMFLAKTFQRLLQLEEHPVLGPVRAEKLSINGQLTPSLDSLLGMLHQRGSYALFGKVPEFTCIHGDLCLSNMLYDPRNGILKLIDPRGSFSGPSVYGDPRYDLAKLRHSFSGGYDLIIHDRFSFVKDGSKVSYKINETEHQGRIKRLFLQELQTRFPEHAQSISVIEALLFLSMVPLHKDHFHRQCMMLVRGIELLAEALRAIEAYDESFQAEFRDNHNGGSIVPI